MEKLMTRTQELQAIWQAVNKDKLRSYVRKYHRRNKVERSAYTIKMQNKRQALYQALKAKLSCVICKENTPCCLQFHHLDPTQKDNAISQISRLVSVDRLLTEMSKCMILCGNCHAKFHAGLITVDASYALQHVILQRYVDEINGVATQTVAV